MFLLVGKPLKLSGLKVWPDTMGHKKLIDERKDST